MSTRNPRPVVTFPIVLRELTVLRVADVTPGMRRVTLGGEQLRAFHRDGLDLPALRSEGFDDHVKFFFADGDAPPVLPGQNVSSLDWPADARPIAKDYTPVRYDPEAGEIDFDFVRHEGGVASTWAQAVKPGEVTWIAGPKMSHGHPEGVDWLLVIGDETALPAIGRWLAEMPAGTRARVFIEVGEESHRQELPTEADATVTWLTRDGAPAGSTDLLERAVRSMEWLPGEVYVWAAGEAVSLKGIRRHLSAERGVPRERTHITGYWRRTEPDPVAGAGQAEDDAHERLHELTDLAPGFAIRAAVTLGLFDLVRDGVSGPAELARRTGAEPSLLGALLTYLVAIGLLEADGDGHRLTAVSEELVEDDHSSDEYHLGGAQAAMDLSLAGLPHTLRTGGPGYRTAGGDRVATAMLADERLAGSARAAVEEEARWVAPGVSGAYDWASVTSLTAGGHGVGTLVNALVKEYPALRVRITALPSELRVLREEILDTDVAPRVELSPRTGPVPHGGSTVLVSRLLERLADEDAVLALSEAAGALPADGTLLLVEQTRPAAPDEDAALQHLRLACLFGSGLRSQEELEALTERAGLRIRRREDVGWDHRLWVLDPAGGR
ncbi:NADPH-dependent ferric siderophore reductase, contains FAD-binding and SIP domains [Streptomyces sp. Ncost-T6T-1]|uniref:SIP domain-containing protein n=1 Tax=Streptomyces sp. Ncost-T6T-1 TaxID=1100828 RepID=UPI000804DE6D|nr:SIP domain-containing protein [Streptomyces sp. Ncost-T6T-1]SBV06190.1 NADPH-dependent ferric siderophore reductase, contains FAD-binding and SIP domains [Streptomyces sp. Ncost-T6T-1]